MANMFSWFLTLATLLTGIVWLTDKLLWKHQRLAKIDAARAEMNGEIDEKTLAKVAPVSAWVDNLRSIFPVILFVLIVRTFIFEPFQIPSGSMMPTLLSGDFILVNKFDYGLRDPLFNKKFLSLGEPKRGDVTVFRYPVNPKIDFIKRVVGLPGDTVIYRNKTLYIKPACKEGEKCQPAQAVSKSYLYPMFDGSPGLVPDVYEEQLGKKAHQILRYAPIPELLDRYYQQPGRQAGEWKVPAGHYFVMGDNRDNSEDSRYWGFMPEENLAGRAVAIWMSFTFNHASDSWFSWVPTGIRFQRIGAIQ